MVLATKISKKDFAAATPVELSNPQLNNGNIIFLVHRLDGLQPYPKKFYDVKIFIDLASGQDEANNDAIISAVDGT